jgi:hypothetical protein
VFSSKSPQWIKKELSHNTRPQVAPAIWSGTALRISFLTPERDVNVEEPVKFMARYVETAGITGSHA